IPNKREAGGNSPQIGSKLPQCGDKAVEVLRGAIVNDIQVLGEARRPVRDCRGPTHDNKRNALFAECAEEAVEIDHGRFARASRPARRSSSAKRARAIAFRNRSSTVSLRFSRISVRSMSFL